MSRCMVRHLPFQTSYSLYLAEKKGIDLIRCSPRSALPGRNPPLLVDFGHSYSTSLVKEGARGLAESPCLVKEGVRGGWRSPPSLVKERVMGWLGAYVGRKLSIVRCSARLPGLWSAAACFVAPTPQGGVGISLL